MQEDKIKKVQIAKDDYYLITNVDEMRPFFMSIVSDSNHWMFISSNGGLTAGRKDADHALFPYYTDDKITETYDLTGSKSVFQISKDGKSTIWEPFSSRFEGLYRCSRNLYKHVLGNKILFEEVNHDLNLTFRYQWSSSDQFGFVRESTLINHSDEEISLAILDGIQNIMPYGVNSDIQFIRSNLVDAYKKSELEQQVGLGIYTLSSIIVDRAEPSEALKANIAWSLGLDDPTHLICSQQIDAFRKGIKPVREVDIKAEKGAYLLFKELTIEGGDQKDWMIIADVNQSAASIALIRNKINKSGDLINEVKADIDRGTQEIINLTAASDGLQTSEDDIRNTRHYSNTLFNIMRGGIFDDNYTISKKDFTAYLFKANSALYEISTSNIEKLPEQFSIQEIITLAKESADDDLIRLSIEYLPLKFSRRHGDPSRPWNRFSINTKDEAGEKVLDYEGNWRDIFQNWEALAHSYPEFIEGMIYKFLNASTFDGYNPYRVTKDGFDWEVIEENDPWSYIGYWGDHQIIYLQKFLEFIEGHYPGKLVDLFARDLFVFANVPYKIKSYEDTLTDPKDTILFDDELDKAIRNRREEMGADGALVQDVKDSIVKVNLLEKLLVTALAKLSNFIPEAGIWLNTQRPEWNDANNALVGNGVSMVTLYYLRRFFRFFQNLLESDNIKSDFEVSEELHVLFQRVHATLEENQSVLSGQFTDQQRKKVLDGLGSAGSEYRNGIYEKRHSGNIEDLSLTDLRTFSELVLKYLDHSIEANKRSDGMYHAYNLMSNDGGNEVSIDYLDEMLEGQVAVLSSGKLTPEEALEVMDALKTSSLFREDQYSYILYPNKELPRFVAKNNIPQDKVESSKLLQKLIEDRNIEIIEKDIDGKYHFNGKFTNAAALNQGLSQMAHYADMVREEREQVLGIFEEVFNHKAFTGRSGTFFGYEGLGSIYWHMVSKLVLAVQECCLTAIEQGAEDSIIDQMLKHYYEMNEGIGVHKSPQLYGAFPVDPYSHTPFGKGVQQPGMTGQVKEDILSRIGELGVFVKNGQIHFNPCLLKAQEFTSESRQFDYISVTREKKSISLSKDMVAFTYCQVPVVYWFGGKKNIEVIYSDGTSVSIYGLAMDRENSQEIFRRNGRVESVRVSVERDQLR